MAKKKQQKGKTRVDGEGTFWQLPDGRYMAQVTVFAGGKRKYRSKICQHRRDVPQALAELNAQKRTTAVVDPSVSSLGSWLDAWIRDEVRPNKSANTTDSYEIAVGHVQRTIGGTRLVKLQPQHVKRMLTLLREDGVPDRTRQNVFVVFKRAMNVALNDGYLVRNPCAAVEKPKAQKAKPNPLTLEEATRLLKACEGHRLEAVFVLALTTGMRQGEIFGVDKRNIDLKVGLLEVEWQLVEVRGQQILQDYLKTDSSRRTIELTDRAVSALKAHRKRKLKEGFASRDQEFVSTTGGLLWKGSFNRSVWKPLLKTAKIEYRGFHQLRHTFATLQLLNRVEIHTVSKILGHAKVSTTMDTYAGVLESMTRNARDQIGRLLG